VQNGEVSLAWARRKDAERQPRGGDDNYGSGGRATRWSEVGVGLDDNNRGGDDNYPRLVVTMGSWDGKKDVAGTGRNSCR
jgi:hypothetical protein